MFFSVEAGYEQEEWGWGESQIGTVPDFAVRMRRVARCERESMAPRRPSLFRNNRASLRFMNEMNVPGKYLRSVFVLKSQFQGH